MDLYDKIYEILEERGLDEADALRIINDFTGEEYADLEEVPDEQLKSLLNILGD